MLRQKMRKIFKKVQNSSSAHQKHIQILTDVFKKYPYEEFVAKFLECLQCIVCHSAENNMYVKRALCFSSRFSASITQKEEREDEIHNFLSDIIHQMLQWCCLDIYDLRYNSCYFITMLLQDIGEEVQLEFHLINELQRVMLERLQETKVAIRLKAMSALIRLQDPNNQNCPVIAAYLQALLSPNASIRREALNIAPCKRTLDKIKDRVRDVDSLVRSMAFHKCADIGPRNFKIVDRNMILSCGFKERDSSVKAVFYDYLLPKWLTAYNGRYLDFLGGLKLVASEEDLETMAYLGEELLKDFYSKHPINDLIAVLPLNEDKVIDVDKLATEVTLYWNILSRLLRDSTDMDEQLNQILPELPPFCQYLERVIKAKSHEQMDEWKLLEYHFDLFNLLEIADNYDYGDEVGRRIMFSLITTVLQQHRFSRKVTRKLISIAYKCSSNIELFTHDMCQLISDIKEPLTEEPLSQDQQRDRDFKVSALKVKMNILQEQQNEAVASRDYKSAQNLDNELKNCTAELEKLMGAYEMEKVRITKSDSETLCRCLDILGGVLELPMVKKPTPALLSCKQHFLVPLVANGNIEVHWRILKCLTLFSLIDKPTAEEYAKIICIPIATYRTIPIENISALTQAICGITDLILLYGVKIVSIDDETDNTANQNSTRRRLYNNNNDNEENISNSKHNLTGAYIFEILLDMLDDDRPEIRYKAVVAVASLIQYSFSVTSSMLSRILLKWYSSEKLDVELQVRLGILIDIFIHMKKSSEVMKEAITPTLLSIINAPKTSPLADVDVDNVLMFFAEMLNISSTKDNLKIGALDICMKITEPENERIVPLLTKLLCHLDVQLENADASTELIERIESLLDVIKEKMSKKHLEKFLNKLKQQSQIAIHITSNTDVITIANSAIELEEESQIPKETLQVKRRKRRPSKECVVVLERLDLNKEKDALLQPILENDSEEMECDDNLNIETPTSNSSRSSETRNERFTAISETSDSESFSNESTRAMHLRKKRIL